MSAIKRAKKVPVYPRFGEYGAVVCIYGPFEGRAMEYDDDTYEGGIDCILVCGPMWPTGRILEPLPRKWFRMANAEELAKVERKNAAILRKWKERS